MKLQIFSGQLYKYLFMLLWVILLLAGCSTPPPATTPAATPASPSTAPAHTPATKPPEAITEEITPTVLIRGKSATVILDSIVKFRTQKGMKLVLREPRRVELSMAVPKSSPPAEAHMIYSLSPAPEGLRLSAQVFQIVQHGNKKQTRDITAGLRDKLEEELAGYAR